MQGIGREFGKRRRLVGGIQLRQSNRFEVPVLSPKSPPHSSVSTVTAMICEVVGGTNFCDAPKEVSLSCIGGVVSDGVVS